MTEDPPSWTIIETIRGGGPLPLALHGWIFLVGVYVVLRTLTACLRHTGLPIGRYVFLSFLPLVFASLGVFCCLIAIRVVYFSRGLVDPWALPAHLANARLFLYFGWLWTALSLSLVFIASRGKTAQQKAPPVKAGLCD